MTIREILGDLLNIDGEYVDMKTGEARDIAEDTTCIMCGFPLSKVRRRKIIDHAEAAIRKHYLEMLPEKGPGSYIPVEDVSDTSYVKGYLCGYSDARDEMRRRIEGD